MPTEDCERNQVEQKLTNSIFPTKFKIIKDGAIANYLIENGKTELEKWCTYISIQHNLITHERITSNAYDVLKKYDNLIRKFVGHIQDRN